MTCTDLVCGTGGWSGPKPGDPSNNVLLSAVAQYGGIDVSWTYPTTNSHAVAHTLLFRGINSVFEQSVQRAVVAGNFFFDRIPKDETQKYYYWIKMVSINGTVGDVIGPVSATPKLAIEGILEDLTGLIDAGYLAQSLRSHIEMIDLLNRQLGEEILDRIANNEALAAALDAVQSETGQAMTYLQQEVVQRTSDTEALISSINVLAAGIAGNAAAILEEKTIRVTADEAAASDRQILYGKLQENEAAIVSEANIRTTADQALAHDISTLVTQNAQFGAALQAEANARVTKDTALANQITTAQTTLNNNLVSVQTNLESKITTVNGKVTEIGALYTAKVDVNGLIGGFGIYNNGTFVEAGFDVDRFWVGRTTNKVKPFIIDSGVVYIDKARIRDADIDTLKIAGNAVTVPMSSNFGATAGASFSYNGYIPAGTKMLVLVSCSNPYDPPTYVNNMVVRNNGVEICNSNMGYGLQSFATVTTAVNGAITVDTTYAVNGLNITIIGCRR